MIWRLNILFVFKLYLSKTSFERVLDWTDLINLYVLYLQALPGLHITSLNSVLSQGMNVKKKHEVSSSLWNFCNCLLYKITTCHLGPVVLDKKILSPRFQSLLYQEIYWSSISQIKTISCLQVEVLSAVVNTVAESVRAQGIVDVGAGQV